MTYIVYGYPFLTWYSLNRHATTEPVVDLESPTWQVRITGALNLVPWRAEVSRS